MRNKRQRDEKQETRNGLISLRLSAFARKKEKETRRFGNQVECFEVKYGRNTLEINRAGQPAAGWLGEIGNSGTISTYFTKRSEVYFYRISSLFPAFTFLASHKIFPLAPISLPRNNYFFISCSNGKFRCFGKKI